MSITPSPSVLLPQLFNFWTPTDRAHICVTHRECWFNHQDEYQVSVCTYGNYHNLCISLFISLSLTLFLSVCVSAKWRFKYLTMSASGAKINLVGWKMECLFFQLQPVLLYSINGRSSSQIMCIWSRLLPIIYACSEMFKLISHQVLQSFSFFKGIVQHFDWNTVRLFDLDTTLISVC